MKKNFKIVFYRSDEGHLAHMKTLHRKAEKLVDLVLDPPEEFFEMLEENMPIHGWAELEEKDATVFVIFAPRSHPPLETETFTSTFIDAEEIQFKEWLNGVKPSDFGSEK